MNMHTVKTNLASILGYTEEEILEFCDVKRIEVDAELGKLKAQIDVANE